MARVLSDEEVTLCAGIYPQVRWHGGMLTEQGSSYRVAISPPADGGPRAVIRFGRHPESAAALARIGRLHPLLAAQLSGSGMAVPLPLGPVQQAPSDLGCGPAMAVSFVPGLPHPPHRGQPGEFAAGGDDPAVTVRALVALLTALQRIEVDPVAAELAPPFSYRGPWSGAKVATAVGFVAEHAPELVAPASRVLAAVLERPDGFGGARGVVHGDLAGENMRWSADFSTVTGLLDWDLASVWDPAINLMHLSLWHGAGVVQPVAEGLVSCGILSGDGVDEAGHFADRVRYWSGVWALENLWHAAQRQEQARRGVLGVKPIKPAALRRLFAKLGPRLTAGAEATTMLVD